MAKLGSHYYNIFVYGYTYVSALNELKNRYSPNFK